MPPTHQVLRQTCHLFLRQPEVGHPRPPQRLMACRTDWMRRLEEPDEPGPLDPAAFGSQIGAHGHRFEVTDPVADGAAQLLGEGAAGQRSRERWTVKRRLHRESADKGDEIPELGRGKGPPPGRHESRAPNGCPAVGDDPVEVLVAQACEIARVGQVSRLVVLQERRVGPVTPAARPVADRAVAPVEPLAALRVTPGRRPGGRSDREAQREKAEDQTDPQPPHLRAVGERDHPPASRLLSGAGRSECLPSRARAPCSGS